MKPVSIFIVVDFPAPFGPKKPTTCRHDLKLILAQQDAVRSFF